ncbi:hypothetical protein [Sporomusa aerivorans]|uniref:hypothetical protein n=1 Tax=Sporomusa aerivorans TaxID=204936 RepID=UPI00352B4652
MLLSKPEKNYYLNIALLLFGSVSAFTGVALSINLPYLMPFLMAVHIKFLHELASYSLTVLVIFHLIFHFDWFKAMTKKGFDSSNHP